MNYCSNPDCIYSDPTRQTYYRGRWYSFCSLNPLPDVMAYLLSCDEKISKTPFTKLPECGKIGT